MTVVGHANAAAGSPVDAGQTALSLIFRRREIMIRDAITIEYRDVIRKILEGGLHCRTSVGETTRDGKFL